MIASTLGDLGSLLSGLAAVGLVVGGVLAARQAYEQYKVQVNQASGQRRENRGRWLTELSKRFSDTPSFVMVREHLHLGESSELVAALRRRQQFEQGSSANGVSPADAKLLVALDDYLDFLGLIEYLVAHKYLDPDAAWNLFDWYVINQLDIGPINEEITESFHLVQSLRERFQELRAQNP